MSMKRVAVANAKGGVTKTTITGMLAVRCSAESDRVCMLDLNEDQGNLTNWWVIRGQLDLSPRLIEVENKIRLTAKQLEEEGCEWLFIDTPPLEMDLIEQAVAIADFVLVPVRTSFFDVSSIYDVTAMCRKHQVSFAFVLAAVDNRFKSLVPQTLALLKPEGPVLDTRISHRIQYIQAVTQGRTGAELSKELADETDKLWAEVKALTEAAAIKGAVNV